MNLFPDDDVLDVAHALRFLTASKERSDMKAANLQRHWSLVLHQKSVQQLLMEAWALLTETVPLEMQDQVPPLGLGLCKRLVVGLAAVVVQQRRLHVLLM
jgi:hypothetical protein